MNGTSVAIVTRHSLLSEGVASLLVRAGAMVTMVVSDQPGAIERLVKLEPQLVLLDRYADGVLAGGDIRRVCPNAVVIGLTLDESILEVYPDRRVPVQSQSEFIAHLEKLVTGAVARPAP